MIMMRERLSVNDAKVVHETIDDEVIIINLETGTYYSILQSGVDVWLVLAQGVERQQLLEAMANRYAAERDVVVEAVNTLVDELVSAEILVAEPTNYGASESKLELSAILPNGSEHGTVPFVAPSFTTYTNMSDLLLLDPIHDVNDQGWPNRRPE